MYVIAVMFRVKTTHPPISVYVQFRISHTLRADHHRCPFHQTYHTLALARPYNHSSRDVEPYSADWVVECGSGLEARDVEAEPLGLQHRRCRLRDGPARAFWLLPDH